MTLAAECPFGSNADIQPTPRSLGLDRPLWVDSGHSKPRGRQTTGCFKWLEARLTAWQRLDAYPLVMNVRVRDPKQLSLPPVTMDWTLDFASGELKQAVAYWKSRCGERRYPARVDLNPKDMVRFLKHVMLVDVQHMSATSRAYRIRLAGTSVEQVYGPITGHQIDEALPPVISDRWRECFDAVATANRPLRLTGRVGFEYMTWLQGEVLVAPLGEEGNPISMIFVVFVCREDARSLG